MSPSGRWRTVLMADSCELFNFGRLGADKLEERRENIQCKDSHFQRMSMQYNSHVYIHVDTVLLVIGPQWIIQCTFKN